jgi:hypothetical protein
MNNVTKLSLGIAGLVGLVVGADKIVRANAEQINLPGAEYRGCHYTTDGIRTLVFAEGTNRLYMIYNGKFDTSNSIGRKFNVEGYKGIFGDYVTNIRAQKN